MHFHWNGIKNDVAKYVKCCDACQRSKLVHLALPDLHPPAVYGPLWHVHIDLAGPFPTSPLGLNGLADSSQPTQKAWVCIMIDSFTKVAEFAAVYSKEPVQIAQVFYNLWICRYGCPGHVTSNNGQEFATDFGHMLARLGIEHITTSVHHPAANGAVERLVGSILTKHVNDHVHSWLQSLPFVRMCYMQRVHRAIGVSPNEMLISPKACAASGRCPCLCCLCAI